MRLNDKFENSTKKYMKKSIPEKMLPLFYIFLIILVIGLYYFYNDKLKRNYIEVTGISSDNQSITISYGESTIIPVKIEPEDATFKGIIWTSSNPDLVNVDSVGKITVLKNENGFSKVKATTNESAYQIEIIVNVLKIESVINVSGIDILTQNQELKFGESLKINTKIYPENATNKNIKWTSSNQNVVSVDNNGIVKVISNVEENINITAETEDGKFKDTIAIKTKKIKSISEVKVKEINIKTKETSINYNSSFKINYEILPNNSTNKNVKWTSSNPNLISVDNAGNLKILKNENGESTITVKTVDGGYSDSIKIKVIKIELNSGNNNNDKPKTQNIKVTGLSIDKSDISLKYNEEVNIKATIIPSNATNKTITWKSDNTGLVTVDNNGNIKAKSGQIGVTTITATSKDGGYSKKIKVKVLPSGNYISFAGGNNYSEYKTNMLLQREGAVMQSFAINGDYIYISQQQVSNGYGAHFSKIKLSEVQNQKGEGQAFKNNVAVIQDTGHAGNIDIEITNNKAYLWTGCSLDGAKQSYHCRIPLSGIKFGDRIKNEQNYSVKVKDGTIISVDSDNRIFTKLTGDTRYHTFTTYNLDDYIANKEKAKVISQFQVDHGKKGVSRQGLEVHGNYIYSYEGNPNNSKEKAHVVYLSVFTLTGERIVYRKPINYPNNNNYYWEPEGIKIYNNKIYIGFGRIEKNKDKKTANIYILK